MTFKKTTICMVLLASGLAYAARDTTFGVNGIATARYDKSSSDSENDEYAAAGFADAAGRIWYLGQRGSLIVSGHFIGRLTAAGQVDTGFGNNGIVEISGMPVGTALTVDEVNQIIYVAGYDNNSNAVVGAYAFSGALVAGFNSGAVKVIDTPDKATPSAIVLAGGNLYLAGNERRTVTVNNQMTEQRDSLMLSLTTAGQLNTAFNGTGMMITDYAGGARRDRLDSILVDSQGRLVVAGTAELSSGNSNFLYARLSTAGVADTAFGSSGVSNHDNNVGDDIYMIRLLAGDAIEGLGFSASSVENGLGQYVFTRINADGSVNASFSRGTAPTTLDFTGLSRGFNPLGFVPVADGKFVMTSAIRSTADGTNNDDIALTHNDGADTNDSVPDSFAFSSRSGVAVNTEQTSNTIIVDGTTTNSAITISGGSYSIGCNNNFVTAPGTVQSGDSVCVRHTSATTAGSSTSTSLSIGGVRAEFRTTTASASPAPTPSPTPAPAPAPAPAPTPSPASSGSQGGGGAFGLALSLGLLASRRLKIRTRG